MHHERTRSPRLILASASKQRSNLLTEAGFDFEIIPCPIDEPSIENETRDAPTVAESISRFKAIQVAKILIDQANDSAAAIDNTVILGADTVVEQDGDIFGKAADAHHARQILTRLTSAPHNVITAVTIIETPGMHEKTIHEVTRVHMRPMSPQELDNYIASQMWQGKAGAYGIQDHDDKFVTRIEGSWSNVVGLPMEQVTPLLESYGIKSEPRPHQSEPRPYQSEPRSHQSEPRP